MDSKWRSNDIINFLNIYVKFDCLWDPTSPDHVKRDAREAAFENIIDELADVGIYVTLEVLRKKIKSLRDTYRNEVNRINQSKKNGGAIYTPKLAWFSIAEYVFGGKNLNSCSTSSILAQALCAQQDPIAEDGECSYGSPEEADEDEEDEEEHEEKIEVKELPKRRQIKVEEATILPSPHLKRRAEKCPSSPLPPKSLRSTRKNDGFGIETAVDRLNDVVAQMATHGDVSVDDQYERFGRHVAAQLRELPVKKFIMLQDKIQSLITKERLSCL